MTNTKFASATDTLSARGTAEPKSTTPFLSRLSVGQKLLLSSALIGVPLLGVSGILGSLYYQNYRDAQLQTLATQPFSNMEPLQLALRTMRGYDSAHVPPQALADAAKQTALLVTAAQATGIPEVRDSALSIKSKTESLINQIKGKQLSADDILTVTGDILYNDLQDLFSTLSKRGNLMTASDPKARELARMSSETFPTLLPKIGGIFGGLIVDLEKARKTQGGALNEVQLNSLTEKFAEADQLIQQFSASADALTTDFPDLKTSLGPAFETALSDTSSAFNVAQSGSIDTRKVTVTQQKLFDVSDAYLASQYKAFDQTVAAMRETFRAQQDSAQRKLLVLLAALAALLTLVGLLLSRVIQNITRPLGQLTQASEKLASGDLNVQVQVQSRDELGLLTSSFNSAASQLKASADRNEQERLEAQKLQHNVGEFLDVTMDIAEGDLTKRGKVTEDVLGNVVDSINLMVEELAHTLRGVQEASNSVTNGSKTMLNSTNQIAQGALTTAEQTRQVAQQASDLNTRIQAMATTAQASAEKARQALSASQQGQEAVSSTLQGMQEIRNTAQETAQRVQALTARSEEIQQIVDSISHIASQTNLLSLHASIEAAGAGEAGSRFAIVAEEVRQLADESNTAAGRIAALIAGIQAEIREVSQSMQQNAAQVEQGFMVAGQAGERLRQIGEISEASAQLAQDMSQAAGEQVSGVQQMGQSVQQIAQIAEHSQTSVQQGRSAAEQLQQLAQQLDQSLRRFRLPS